MSTTIFFSRVTAEILSTIPQQEREFYLIPDRRASPLSELYTEIVEAASENATFHDGLHRLMKEAGATKDEASKIFHQLFIALETRPKLIVLSMDEPYGCHFRIDQLIEYIFLDISTCAQWESAEIKDSMSYEALARRELMKATIIHELSHLCTSEVRKMDATPEKLKVLWDKEGEAGFWMEYKLFGGILSVRESGKKFDAATLQVAKEERMVLTWDMLAHGRAHSIIHYPTEFADRLSSYSSITPSPSQNQGEGLWLKDLNREGNEGSAAPKVKCTGVIYDLF